MEAQTGRRRDKIKAGALVLLIALFGELALGSGGLIRIEQRDWHTGNTIRELKVAGQTSLLDRQSMPLWT